MPLQQSGSSLPSQPLHPPALGNGCKLPQEELGRVVQLDGDAVPDKEEPAEEVPQLGSLLPSSRKGRLLALTGGAWPVHPGVTVPLFWGDRQTGG